MTAADHPLSPEDLMAYLDGELPGAQAAIVQAHVAGCDECQRSSGELRGVSREMARWQVEDAPVTLTAPLPTPGTRNRRRLRFGWLLKPAAAYALGALSVVALFSGSFNMMNAQRMVVTAWHPTALEQEFHESDRHTAFEPRLDAQTGLASPVEPVTTAEQPSQTPSPAGPSIARTARLRLAVKDMEVARPAVERILANMGGWFRQVDATGSADERQGLMAALMIPAKRLDDAMAALRPLGRIIDESTKSEDVTEQVVDVQARLSNARNTEKRLVDLLQRRTGNLADVLAAEREIARVREEIERFDGQRTSLERRVAYATLLLELGEELHPSVGLGPHPLRSVIRDEFTTGLGLAMNSALGVASLVVRLAPVLLLWVAILGWPVLMLVRWNRRRLNPEP